MRCRWHGAGLLGLLTVAALGAMALAASAQAVTPEFLINKKAVGALKATFGAEQVGRGSLLVAGLNFEVNCEKFSVDEGEISSSTDAKIILLYTECTTLPVKAEALLLPTELTNGKPAILAEKIKSLIKLTKVGELTEECFLPFDNTVKAELCLKVDSNNTAELGLLASQAIQGECKERKTLEALGEEVESGGVKDKLLYGGQEVFLDGEANVSLTGAHKGLNFGISSKNESLSAALCKVKTGSCGAYALGTTVAASQEQETKFVFPYEGEELEPPCRVSSMSGKTTKEGEVLTGELTALSFKECGGGLCTVSAQHLPYKAEFKATSEGNGTMTWSSGGGGAPAFTIKCLGVAKCIYGASEVAFTITGGTPAKLSNSGVALKREAGSEEACGETGAKWEGVAAVEGKVLYKITTPSPLFVRLF